MMNVQNYINMTSALIVFFGGLAIIFWYPGALSSQYRILIGLFVTLYFALRMGQTILAIKRERRESKSGLKGITGSSEDGPAKPKTP
jgi:hypothetical protein